MVVVVVQIVRIQYADLDYGFDVSGKELTTKMMPVEARRGNIVSDDGSILAASVTLYEVRMDLKTVDQSLFDDNVDSLAIYLSQTFKGRTAREWETQLRKNKEEGNQYFLIGRNIRYDVYKQMKSFPIWREGKYKGGFIPVPTNKRKRPQGLLAARTIGYEREHISVGLEGAYTYYLAGSEGQQIYKKVGSVWRPSPGDYAKDPVDGMDVWTTIDVKIQDVAESELLNQLKAQDAKHGCVIVMEVETGYIKAIANLSRNDDGEYYEVYNHAVGRATEPGSTFKLFSLMALLEDGKMDVDDTLKAYGKYEFYGKYLHDSRSGGYGKISLQRAFEVSSNVFSKAVYESYKDEPQRYVDRLKTFGVHKPLGLSIKGEGEPRLRNVGDEGWSGLSLPWMSIGYEVQMTPLQILAYYNAVANNGTLLKPQFVKEVRRHGKVEKTFEPIVLNPSICSYSTLRKVQECLEGVVESGTGKTLQAAHFKIAGKTGTAWMANGGGGYGNDSDVKYQASFAGYFPAENPKYSCIVVIAAPTRDIYGAKVSGTVFKAIADKVYATDLKYHKPINTDVKLKENWAFVPDEVKFGENKDIIAALEFMGVPAEKKSYESQWGVAIPKDKKISIDQRVVDKNKVPSVVGMSVNDAIYMLENLGIRVHFTGAGKVVEQSIPGGTVISKGSRIRLVLE